MCTFLRSVALVTAVLIKYLSTYGVLQWNIVMIFSLLLSPCTLLRVLAYGNLKCVLNVSIRRVIHFFVNRFNDNMKPYLR